MRETNSKYCIECHDVHIDTRCKVQDFLACLLDKLEKNSQSGMSLEESN